MSIDREILRGTIVTSRVRLARNLKDLPFKINDVALAKEVIKNVNRALVKSETFNLYYMSNLSELTLNSMKEEYLISENLIKNKECGATLINTKKDISVMINEEDVIREQCFMRGLSLNEAYKRLNKVDDELCKNLEIAFDEDLGFLTACATNLGTGLRASVMLFLPALTLSGKINSLNAEISKLGLTVRGAYGEGSSGEGYYYQISNEVTLGIKEEDIIFAVSDAVERICIAEREEKEKLFGKNELKTMDKVKKAFGILTNAVLLSYDEFLEHISEVKLGAMLGFIDISNVEKIDDLIFRVRPNSLCMEYGKKLSTVDRDLYRAEVVAKQLLKLRN